jgi:S1-C subfamily serine protease
MSFNTHSRIWPTSAIAVFTLLAVATAQSPKPAKDVPTIAREAGPSVVRVVLRDQTGLELGSGSGFAVGSDGRVVTNYHVIHTAGTTQGEIRFTAYSRAMARPGRRPTLVHFLSGTAAELVS